MYCFLQNIEICIKLHYNKLTVGLCATKATVWIYIHAVFVYSECNSCAYGKESESMAGNTHVPDKLEGYMLQVRHALFELISVDDRIVSVEAYDDVAIEKT